ncbi:peroxisome assembly protein (Peroxin-2) [Coemansia sp. RSA 552]|nr:peroxisome assembly protein (Peroxin-2) [Coemansia sp. RSA 552]
MNAKLPQCGLPWAALGEQARQRAGAGGPVVVPRSGRVNKLDADLLDAELADMIREPVAGALSLVRPGLVDTYRLEIDTGIRALLFWLSVGAARRATYGQGLQNLRYARSGRGFGTRIHLFGLLSIGGGYAWERLVSAMSARGWADAPRSSVRARLWWLVQRLERAFAMATLVNMLAFVATGQYKTVVERLLRLRLVSARPQLSHAVSFEFLNRQLVWHAFTEFVMFALPLVNPARARAWAARAARRVLRLPPPQADPAVAKLPQNVCAVCFVAARDAGPADARPDADTTDACAAVAPYVAECGHRYCYVCIRTRMLAEADQCLCLRCARPVRQIARFTG